jgi:hypothetical protein
MDNIIVDLGIPTIDNVEDALTGPQGPAGFSPIATVSKTGNVTTVSITDEHGTTTAEVLDGTDGTNGQNNTLTIGTVSSGSTPSATITGDSPNQVLNLVLPKCDTGATGASGTDPTITLGSVETLPAGTPAYVTNSGTATNAVFNFGIPQGIQGSSANALSMPTVVDSLPATGEVGVFYFVPKSYTPLAGTGDSFNLSITDTAGRIDTITINGVCEQDTPPATIYTMTGVSTITIDGTNYTLDLGDIELAKVNSQKDYIYNDGDVWKLHKVIGKIDSYAGETITTDYISTSGSLTVGDTVYYVLDTPETTTITDATITGVLNTILSIELPSCTIPMSITNADVTPNITVGYHTYEQYNQYDKYVYMIETSSYEKIG